VDLNRVIVFAVTNAGSEITLANLMFTNDNVPATLHYSGHFKPTCLSAIGEKNFGVINNFVDLPEQTNFMNELSCVAPHRHVQHDAGR